MQNTGEPNGDGHGCAHPFSVAFVDEDRDSIVARRHAIGHNRSNSAFACLKFSFVRVMRGMPLHARGATENKFCVKSVKVFCSNPIKFVAHVIPAHH